MARHWRGPGRKTRATRTDIEQRRALRELRRRSLIDEAVRELGDRATHERVARLTGIPIGYLTWTFPDGEWHSSCVPRDRMATNVKGPSTYGEQQAP
jgi:hypothetical protein